MIAANMRDDMFKDASTLEWRRVSITQPRSLTWPSTKVPNHVPLRADRI